MRENKSVPMVDVQKFRDASQEEKGSARDEADMLRAEAGVSPWSGQHGYNDKRRPVEPEDYDKAVKIIEQAKAATDISTQRKILSKLGFGSLAVLNSALTTILMPWGAGPKASFNSVMRLEFLNKAQEKLRGLQKEGELFQQIYKTDGPK